jgi:hypothetical protein
MRPEQKTLAKLIREAKEARRRKMETLATAQEILDRARAIAQTIRERVERVSGQATGRDWPK